jgi:hypothetical protein
MRMIKEFIGAFPFAPAEGARGEMLEDKAPGKAPPAEAAAAAGGGGAGDGGAGGGGAPSYISAFSSAPSASGRAEMLKRVTAAGGGGGASATGSASATGGDAAAGGGGGPAPSTTVVNADGSSTITIPGGNDFFRDMFLEQDRKQTLIMAPKHGSGGGQVLCEAAGERVRAAEREGRLLNGDASGFPRGSATWHHVEDCFQWAMQHGAKIKGHGVAEYEDVSIGKLVQILRQGAGHNVWSNIRRRNMATSFSAQGYDIRIYTVGEEPKGPFTGGGAQLAKMPAARELRERHEALVLSEGQLHPTYTFTEINGDGFNVFTSPLLQRRESLAAAALHFPDAGPMVMASLMEKTRSDKCNGISADADIGCIFTRALGTNGKPDDVITSSDIDELQKLFKRQLVSPPSGKAAFAIFLSEEGYELWKGKVPGAQEDFVPHGFVRFPGRPELLWTGLMERPVGAYQLVRHIFDGEVDCVSSKKFVQNASTNPSSCARCKYFTAHYDSGAGAAQVNQKIY